MRKSDARVSVGGNSNRKHIYNAEYNYTGNSREQIEASVADYFPTDYFSSQRTADSMRRKDNYRKQFGNSNHDLNNVLLADVEWDIIDNLNLTANYRGRFQSRSSGLTIPDSHLLDLLLGWRVLKERGRIAFNAYDVLNCFSPISILQNANTSPEGWNM